MYTSALRKQPWGFTISDAGCATLIADPRHAFQQHEPAHFPSLLMSALSDSMPVPVVNEKHLCLKTAMSVIALEMCRLGPILACGLRAC